MTIGVGGSTAEKELAAMKSMRGDVPPIGVEVWEEDEDPTAVVTETVRSLGYPKGVIAVDEATPFFTFDGLRRAGNSYTFVNAVEVTAARRMIKSEHELALMQTAKNITLEAHKAAARIMREGITTTERSE